MLDRLNAGVVCLFGGRTARESGLWETGNRLPVPNRERVLCAD